FNKHPVHTSMLSGEQWIQELLDRWFYNQLGMQKFVFRELLQTLETDAGLLGTWHVSATEQVTIFLH
ncbi:hypothetical protein EDB85DRAFT_1811648, partial [Lactarius pseudohatsudake]